MELGIIGLARSGKTTVFNALTRGHVATGGYGPAETHIGVVKLPDPRLERLAAHFKPKRITPAEICYVDFPGGFGRGAPAGPFLQALAQTDALVHVVRAFRNEAVPHPEGSVDPQRDIALMDMELAFADLALMERRLERLAPVARSGKPEEREAAQKEMTLLERLRRELEAGTPLRAQNLTPEEARAIYHYRFLTAKPLLILLNIDEGDIGRAEALLEPLRGRLGPRMALTALCGKLEMELGELAEEEQAQFRAEWGLGEDGRYQVLRLSQEVLNLLSFFTVNPEEARAWLVPRGTTALQAAGKIHSDMEKGFIRAEVLNWEELLRYGSMAEARKHGALRLEGKNYIVQDGDVLHILFSV